MAFLWILVQCEENLYHRGSKRLITHSPLIKIAEVKMQELSVLAISQADI